MKLKNAIMPLDTRNTRLKSTEDPCNVSLLSPGAPVSLVPWWLHLELAQED